MDKALESTTIMVVDDTPANLKLLQKMLQTKGYLVLTFPRGAMALAAAARNPPDLILLDINMPEMSGFEVCKRLKADDALKEIPVIFISALTETGDKVKAFSLGGVDYVAKPFQFEEVNARVETHLRLRRQQLEIEEKHRQLQQAFKEKETLLYEIHHRVKNNLAVVSSLLRLQAKSMDDERAIACMMDSRNRVQSMSAIHETLYQSENLSSIDMHTYLSKLAGAVIQNSTIGSKVNLKIEAENVLIGSKQASPVGLIVNELITNSFKYAFPDNQGGEIKISLQKGEQDQIELIYADSGAGMPEGFDWYNAQSMGLSLVKLLAENQLDGSIDLERENGTKFIIKFKQEEYNS